MTGYCPYWKTECRMTESCPPFRNKQLTRRIGLELKHRERRNGGHSSAFPSAWPLRPDTPTPEERESVRASPEQGRAKFGPLPCTGSPE